MNEQVRCPSVRVIGHDGEVLGVMPPREALQKARDYGLDLVEVSPTANPPVCKFLDFGKYSYELQKKKKEAKKKQIVVHLKEVKIRPGIGEHDYQTKMRHAREFIEGHDKVKFTLRFRGREITHKELADALFARVIEDLKDIAKPEMFPRMEGRQMIMVLGPI